MRARASGINDIQIGFLRGAGSFAGGGSGMAGVRAVCFRNIRNG